MLKLVVNVVVVNEIFYMDLGAYEANGNANEIKIQKWGIKARTFRLNTTIQI
jgi:hypothetical protein